MIPTPSDDLFHAIEDKLQTIPGLLARFGPLQVEEDVRPMVAIVPVSDEHTRISKHAAMQQINITLRILAVDAWAIESWRRAIHEKMHEDTKWGGLVKDTEALNDRWRFDDPVFPQTAVDLFYRLTY